MPGTSISVELCQKGYSCRVVDAVERAAGLTFFSDEIKKNSKHICKTTKCDVIVRRFDDAQKNTKRVSAPK